MPGMDGFNPASGQCPSAQSVKVALNAAGRHLLSVRSNGTVLWSTPQAIRLVNAATGSDEGVERVGARIRTWMDERRHTGGRKDPGFVVETGGEAAPI